MNSLKNTVLISSAKNWPSRTKQIHALCWILFGVYEVAGIVAVVGYFGNPWMYIVFFILNISLFYTHATFALPLGLGRRGMEIWRLPFFVVLELGTYVAIALLMTFILQPIVASDGKPITGVMVFNIAWRGIYFMLYGTGYFFLTRFIEKKKEQVEHEKQMTQLNEQLHQMELDYLRAQINPHFLFNTLSFINYSAKHSPAEADEAIVLLKEVLDFITRGANQKSVTVEQELQQTEKLVRLNRLRFGESLCVQIEKDIQVSNQSVIPMVLLTLVENIFKHGNFRNHRQPVVIRVESNESKIRYYTSNLTAKHNTVPSHRTGLTNIALRLARTYPETHHFEYRLQNNVFEVNLEVLVSKATPDFSSVLI